MRTVIQPSNFRANRPITVDEIARYAPSILADEAHESRGERYAFIPTMAVLDGLKKEGFEPFAVGQTRVRDIGKKEHTKHLVRLRHPDMMSVTEVGSEIPEIVLVNSHDGSSSYQLMAGVYRLVCSNGMIAGSTHGEIKVRHSGNIIDDVIEGSFRIVEDVERLTGAIDDFKAIQLEAPEQIAFANAAAALKWEPDSTPIDPQRLLRVRRMDDKKSDLWSVFNRTQENLIKGGIAGRSATGRRMSTRAVGGVNEDVRLNRSLWTLADSLAAYKKAA